MSGWRTAWRNLTCKAGLGGLRFHDLRHHGKTELAESKDVSEQTIMAIAGHVSTRRLRHYSNIRRDVMREALDTLSRKPTGSDFSRQDDAVTSQSTSQNALRQKSLSHTYKKNVDVAGIEPATPSLQIRCSSLAGVGWSWLE